MSEIDTAVAAPRGLSPLSLSLPIAMGYIPLGMVFGFLFVKAGAAWWLAPFMSVWVFAGAAQYMAIPMLAAGMSLGAIALATLVVNLRHIFYGLSLLDRLPKNHWARGYLAWALTDENYSVLSAQPAGTPTRSLVGLAMLNHCWWVLGSFLGAVIGSQAQIGLKGLDFSLAALFAVLTVEQWRGARRPLPFVVAAAAYALAHWLVPAQALAVSIAVCVLAGLMTCRNAHRETDDDR